MEAIVPVVKHVLSFNSWPGGEVVAEEEEEEEDGEQAPLHLYLARFLTTWFHAL